MANPVTSDGKAALLRVIERAANKTATARRVRRNKKGADAYATVWNDAVLEVFGREAMVAPTIKNLAMLKRALNRLEASDGERRAFLLWAVQTWDTTTATLFPKITGMEGPNLGWFVGNIGRYWNAYCRKGQAKVSSTRSVAEAPTATDLHVKNLEATVSRLQSELAAALAEIKRLKRRKLGSNGKIGRWD